MAPAAAVSDSSVNRRVCTARPLLLSRPPLTCQLAQPRRSTYSSTINLMQAQRLAGPALPTPSRGGVGIPSTQQPSDDPGQQACASRPEGMKQGTEGYVASKFKPTEPPPAVRQSPRSRAAGGQERTPSSPSSQPRAVASSSTDPQPHASGGAVDPLPSSTASSSSDAATTPGMSSAPLRTARMAAWTNSCCGSAALSHRPPLAFPTPPPRHPQPSDRWEGKRRRPRSPRPKGRVQRRVSLLCLTAWHGERLQPRPWRRGAGVARAEPRGFGRTGGCSSRGDKLCTRTVGVPACAVLPRRRSRAPSVRNAASTFDGTPAEYRRSDAARW